MTQTTLSYSGTDHRRRRRYRLPSRSHLAAAIAGLETVTAMAATLALILILAQPALQPLVFAIPVVAGLVYGVFSGRTALRHLSRLEPRQPVIGEALFAWLVAYASGLGMLVFAGQADAVSRGALFAVAIGAGSLLMALRAAIYLQLTEWMTLGRLQLERVGVAGDASDLALYLINGQIWRQGAQVVETFTLDEFSSDDALARFVERCANRGCTQLVFVSDLTDLDAIERAADACKRFALDVTFSPVPRHARLRLLDISPLGVNNGVQVVKRPIGLRGLVSKRVFDIVAAGIGLVLLAPLFAVVAVMIKRDGPGPVFYRQARRGFNGEEFAITKFRSMRVMEDGRAMKQVVADDPRITRIGAFLRRTSIDELPQLFDVLRGKMSLVGPRPHAISHDAELARSLAQYAHRQRVKPGITGWAQVNGFRGDTSSVAKIEGRTLHDLYYIENWSILFDVWIVLLTVFSRKTRSNAY